VGEYEDVCGPCVAGSFYPASAERLAAMVREFVAGGERPAGMGTAAALIVPHAGYVYSGRIAGRAYACVDGRQVARAVVLAPAHGGGFRGLGVGAFRAFRTPLGEVGVAAAICSDLCDSGAPVASRRAAFRGEHAVEVQLPFLQAVCPRAELVPLLCGDLRPQDTGMLAAELARRVPREGTLWLVSSDFTHYGEAFGYVPFTREALARVEQLDRGAIDTILRGDAAALREYVRATGATICGADAVGLLLAVLAQTGEGLTPHLLGYAQSGQMEHDETQSVGYAAIAFCRPVEAPATTSPWGPAPEAGQYLVQLARQVLTVAVGGGTPGPPEVEAVPVELQRPGASFVSLHVGGQLRGCMGSLEARQALYLDVFDNALNAGFRDPRFGPLQAEELAGLEIEVSVLSELRPIADIAQFEVGRHGILMRRGAHGAVYLPQVAAEHGWDRVTTLEHLCRKAGLPANAWRRGAQFEVFEARVFAEAGGRETGPGSGSARGCP
jgi:AmmeMemoRadiSam system protein B/AmmeMemoRadiSam system protein A